VRLQEDGQSLVALQGVQSPGDLRDAVAALGSLGGAGPLTQETIHDIVWVVAPAGDKAVASSPHGQGLAAGDHLHPGNQRSRWPIRCLREKDLDRSLEGVLGVIGAEREAPGSASQVGLGNGKQREGPFAATTRKRCLLVSHTRVNPRRARRAPRPAALPESRRPPGSRLCVPHAGGRVPSGLR
jgi:hypothetical protein